MLLNEVQKQASQIRDRKQQVAELTDLKLGDSSDAVEAAGSCGRRINSSHSAKCP